MTKNINNPPQPRPEHPKPQFKRESWQNLNGEWDFAFDFSKSGKERKFFESHNYTHKILVPFCPESALSGIQHTDFIPAVWYRRVVTITPQQLQGEVLLHFGAVDYEATVYVNGKEAGQHRGGYSSFALEIGKLLVPGENTIVVYAQDDSRDSRYPSGKQAREYYSTGCMYTRTTGIWQTVWLEFVPKIYIKKIRVYPHAAQGAVSVSVWLSRAVSGACVSALACFEGEKMAGATVKADGDFVSFGLSLAQAHLWDIGAPHLYDLELQLMAPSICDVVASYFGLRSVTLQNGAIYLNGEPVFQRLVLDQGFYPDGIYTAPSDTALKQDIELSMALGFNGARLHEKAFEERFLYYADKLGYLVWSEHANWGFDHSDPGNLVHFLPEWLEIMERDFNHPSIIGWCPFNETWDFDGRRQNNDLISAVYKATKALDPTRPVIDTSGNYHVITDIYDVHDYEQDVKVFAGHYGNLKQGEAYERMPDRQEYKGQPFFVSEYGGAIWAPDDKGKSWGYGNAPKTEEEFAARYEGLTGALLGAEGVCGFCYTQLYDVEQEKNGLYTYDRQKKLSDDVYARIRAVNMRGAKINEL